MRLFIALNFPTDVRAQIREILDTVRAQALQGRFVGDEQLHLTLEFLGDVAPSRISLIRQALDGLEEEPFTLRLTHAGAFRRREGDVFWLGVERSAPLTALQSALHRSLKEKGFALDDRPFTPHITLGRKVQLPQGFDPGALDEAAGQIEAPITTVDLMRSELSPAGAKYSVVYSKRLGNA